MKEYEIKLNDLQRIFIGEVPAHFYLELIFRFLIVYMILIFSMRLMGKRMSSQLSRNELGAVASLAAAVGIPLMNSDRGLLPGIITAAVIIVFQILIAKRASYDKRFESLTQDRVATLVEDGVLQTKAMLHNRISRETLFAQLRFEEISHLGMVNRLYFEAGGAFSLLKAPVPRAGLTVLPEWDVSFDKTIHILSDKLVCSHCGKDKPNATINERCDNCKSSQWINAVEQSS